MLLGNILMRTDNNNIEADGLCLKLTNGETVMLNWSHSLWSHPSDVCGEGTLSGLRYAGRKESVELEALRNSEIKGYSYRDKASGLRTFTVTGLLNVVFRETGNPDIESLLLARA